MSQVPTIRIGRSLGSALSTFGADRLAWFDRASALGPLCRLRLGPVSSWVVTDVELARSILLADAGIWRRPPALVLPIRQALGENLFTLDDHCAAEQRKDLGPALRSRALKAHAESLPDVVEDSIGGLQKGADFDLLDLSQRLVFLAMNWLLHGEIIDEETERRLILAEREVSAWVGTRLGTIRGAVPVAIGSSARRMRMDRTPLVDQARERVARARMGRGTPITRALHDARSRGRPLTDSELTGHLLGVSFAGHETSSASLAWAMLAGVRHREVWAALREDPACARRFVLETLRLSPAAWGVPRTPARSRTRLPSADFDVRVRRGEVVTLYLRAMFRDPEIWPAADRFDPARHLHSDVDQVRALVPFGLGARNCVGQQAAMIALETLVGALARHGNLEAHGAVVEDPLFALRPKRGVVVRFV